MKNGKFLSTDNINDFRLKKIMLEEIKTKITQKILTKDPELLKALKALIADDKKSNKTSN